MKVKQHVSNTNIKNSDNAHLITVSCNFKQVIMAKNEKEALEKTKLYFNNHPELILQNIDYEYNELIDYNKKGNN